ncbi:MAG: HlyD family type I secretion periplasmic adaptor subunit [Pseudomonadota bacterium]
MAHKDDQNFMSELEAAEMMKPQYGAVLLLLSIAGLFAFLIIYAAFAEIDERTKGHGQVMPSSDVQVMQSLEGGVITDIMVREGDIVEKGQILMRIDDVLFASEEGGLEIRIAGMRARKIRLVAETMDVPPVFPEELMEAHPDLIENEMKLYNSRQEELQTALERIEDEKHEIESNIDEINASINKFTKSRSLLAEELEIARKLVAQRAMPEIEKIRLERQYSDATGDLATAREARNSMAARLSGVEKKVQEERAGFRSEALGQLNETRTQLRVMQESEKSAEDRVSRTNLRAPVDGVIQNVTLKTVGGVVEPAQKLIEIIPLEEDLLIRARVAPSDIAFLRPGQDVKVSITAYDPQIYGRLDAKLERISADTVEDPEGDIFFEVDVRANQNYLGTTENPLRITTGMVADIEIVTGKRTILTYILKPILRAKASALSER